MWVLMSQIHPPQNVQIKFIKEKSTNTNSTMNQVEKLRLFGQVFFKGDLNIIKPTSLEADEVQENKC